ncbi:hypothetical protein FOA52_005582 [Chlamydomonas sp. UWO 241]|nr:hypothetical protein FOA52_005582 [Chlamydomonas sp. UWO 241]
MWPLLCEPLVPPGLHGHLHMGDTVESRVHAVNERILDFGAAFEAAVGGAAKDVNGASVAAISQANLGGKV